ncbi:MAG: DEAD/DEAH box helicase [Acidobacteriota bacterium]
MAPFPIHPAVNAFQDLVEQVGVWASLMLDNLGYLTATGYRWWTLTVGSYWMAALVVLGVTVLVYVAAWGLQGSYVRHRRKDPRADLVPVARIELRYSLLFVFEWLSSAFRWFRRLAAALGRRKGTQPSPAKGEPSAPWKAATVGPTFLYASLVCAGAYWLGRLAEPWLRSQLGLGDDASAWQFIALGHSPYAHGMLPLEDQPFAAVSMLFLVWCAIWWTSANLLRGTVFRRDLGANLLHRSWALRRWYLWFGAEDRLRPRKAYRTWAGYTAAAAFLLLFLASAYIDGDLYRVRPSAWSVAALVCLGWVLHLQLEGKEAGQPKEERSGEDTEPAGAACWPEVLEDLRQAHPLRFDAESDAAALAAPRLLRAPSAESSVDGDGVLSPMTLELLSGVLGAGVTEAQDAKLNAMQHDVLYRLSRMAFVHLDPPPVGDELQLTGRSAGALRDESGLRSKHQVVLAPEGSGKTTLALLAAANHALVHTSASLLVVRSNEEAKAVHQHLSARVDLSTARWNLRVRRVGGDFINDLTRRIIPDLVICSLEQLVVDILDKAATYRPFLEHVGLIVVDDVETFAGDAELHAQLAFRRLKRLLGEWTCPADDPEESPEPILLVLGTDSMHQTATWVNTLCGIDGSPRNFYPATGSEDDGGTRQVFYSLNAFQVKAPGGSRRLRPREVVEACERLGVPWTYRPCSDERRGFGSQGLLLRNAAVCKEKDPARAAVVLLEGSVSEVVREIDRLRHVGVLCGGEGDGSPLEVACLAILDPDEEATYRAAQGRTGLQRLWGTLPRPVLRTPSGLTNRTHLASDLLQHWLEVEEILEVFGRSTAQGLRDLLEQNLLVAEQTFDVRAKAHEFERKLNLRALAGAVHMDETEAWRQGLTDDDRETSLTKVAQVELVSPRVVEVQDTTSLQMLLQADADSAPLVFYPGRIFENAKGRFMVVDHQRRSGDHDAGLVQVEPILDDYVSSPRLELRVEGASLGLGTGDQGREPLLLGKHAFDVELRSAALTATPVATLHLAPVTGEIHRRQIFENDKRRRYRCRLDTRVLALYPKSALFSTTTGVPGDAHSAPELTFGGARLLAAALRLLLPTIYRGVRDAVEVGVVLADGEIDGAGPPSRFEDPLRVGDGIYLFDLHTGGSGAVEFISRDGVDHLLGLARLLLTRVEDLRRLLRLHDLWGDRQELAHPERIGLESTVAPPDGGAEDGEPMVGDEVEGEDEDGQDSDGQSTGGPDTDETDDPESEAGGSEAEGADTEDDAPEPAGIPQEHILAALASARAWLDSRLEAELDPAEGDAEGPDGEALGAEGVDAEDLDSGDGSASEAEIIIDLDTDGTQGDEA